MRLSGPIDQVEPASDLGRVSDPSMRSGAREAAAEAAVGLLERVDRRRSRPNGVIHGEWRHGPNRWLLNTLRFESPVPDKSPLRMRNVTC